MDQIGGEPPDWSPVRSRIGRCPAPIARARPAGRGRAGRTARRARRAERAARTCRRSCPALPPPPCASASSAARTRSVGAWLPRGNSRWDARTGNPILRRATAGAGARARRAAREALARRSADQRRPARSRESRPPLRAARAGHSPAAFRRRRGTPPTSRRRPRLGRLEPPAKTALAAHADAPSVARSTQLPSHVFCVPWV